MSAAELYALAGFVPTDVTEKRAAIGNHGDAVRGPVAIVTTWASPVPLVVMWKNEPSRWVS